MVKYENGAFTADDFLTKSECNEMRRKSEKIEYHRAKIQTHMGDVDAESVRNNERVIFDDYELAGNLFNRMLPYLPTEIDTWKPSGLNEKFRFYKYDGEQYFKWHVDGSFKRDYFEVSKLTALIYLNDDFIDGETELSR